MRTVLWVGLAHLVGIAALFGLGLLLNKTIDQYAQDYAGLITIFSSAFGVYAVVVNLLYQKNRDFHLWVNRLLLLFVRTHTYWQPAFDYDLPDGSSQDRLALLQQLVKSLSEGNFGAAKVAHPSANIATVCLDDIMCFVLRIEDSHLHVHLDRRLLIPAHLYDAYRQRLARIAETVQQTLNPTSMRYGMTVSFADGVSNPYYGFFVNRVPSELLHTFQVSFRLDPASSCRIEAGTDHVNIESKSLVDLFEALSQVLNLRAVPGR